jgi:hypothetical protein
MSDRPDWITCIKHTHEEKKEFSWCGERASGAWMFADIDHAVYHAMNGGRLVACKDCTDAIIKSGVFSPIKFKQEVLDEMIEVIELAKCCGRSRIEWQATELLKKIRATRRRE